MADENLAGRSSALLASYDIVDYVVKSRSSNDKSILDLMDIYFLVDEKGRILRCNHNASPIISEKPFDLILKNISSILNKDLFDQIMTSIDKIKTEEIVGADFDFSFSRGEHKRHYKWSIKKLDKISNRRGMVLSIAATDISKIKSLYDELIEKDQELQYYVKELEKLIVTIKQQRDQIDSSQRLVQLGEMAGGIAHEINNPIQIIQMSAELIESVISKGSVKSIELEQRAATIKNTCARVSKVIASMRSLSRPSHHDPFEMGDLGEIIESATVFFREKFRAIGWNYELTCPEGIIIECRPTQIAQIFINLLNNSKQALEESGQEDVWVKVSVFPKDEYVEVLVQDSGPGLPEDALDKWAQPFFTTKEVGSGMGLGLSIVSSILREHGGSIEYLKDEKHTTFKIVFLYKVEVTEDESEGDPS